MIDEHLPELINSVSEATQRNLPETSKEVDDALATVIAFFNNVILYPMKKANISFKYKLESFKEDFEQKVIDIPNEYLQEPPLMIAGPTLEALKYTYDEKELRDMYENLLASAMDTRKAYQVHPSYVDAIKQMSPLDACVLERIVDLWPLPCATVQVSSDEYGILPEYYVSELSDISNPFNVSVSISNLSRLGLIDNLEIPLSGTDYRSIISDSFFAERINLTSAAPHKVKILKRTITLNDYGKDFAEICLSPKETNHAD